MDIDTIAEALGGRRLSRGWLVSCPVPSHGRGRGDLHPSCKLDVGEGAKLLVHCFAGCPQADVVTALKDRGLWPKAGRG